MTLSEMKQSDKAFLTPVDVAEVLQATPQFIRWQARNAPARLGFPVVVIRSRTKIPRIPFIKFMEGSE